jgi:GNAT superfamily N-acetyltransferase
VQPSNSVLVAVESGTTLAVGSVTDAGEITLNYVSPEGRFRGVSRALLTALETRVRERGTSDAPFSVPKRLIASTDPQDMCDDGPLQGNFGTTSSYPMSKELAGPQGS